MNKVIYDMGLEDLSRQLVGKSIKAIYEQTIIKGEEQ